MARPRKHIDEDAIEKWASLGASVRLIADLTGIPESTIRTRYRAPDANKPGASEWKPDSPLCRGYAREKARLLVAYWDGVKKGNPALIIFGLKNKMGWSDTPAPEAPNDLPDLLPPKQG